MQSSRRIPALVSLALLLAASALVAYWRSFSRMVAYDDEGTMMIGIDRFFQARYDTPLVFVQVTTSIALRCVAMALPVGIFTGAAASWALLRRPPAALVGR